MFWEINVSKNGKHFFATAPRSCTTVHQMLEVYDALSRAFPLTEGYVLDVTRNEAIVRHINPASPMATEKGGV